MIKERITNRLNQNSAITLIALVITIIVLLILAGVTIASISGNQNIMSKANEAAQKDAIAAAKEEIVLAAHDELLKYYDGKYVNQTSSEQTQASVQDVVTTAATTAVNNIKNRNNELNKSSVSGNIITLKTKTLEVTGTIGTDGSITWGDVEPIENDIIATTSITVNEEDVTLTSDNVKDYYGTEIVTINNIKYGLYYVDFDGDFGAKGTVYLKALSSVDSISLSGGISGDSQILDAVKIMKELNPDWAANRGTTAYADFEDNEKGAAYLCNQSNSTLSGIKTAFENKYGASNVNYVVGAPSVEMFVKAINQAGNLTGTNAIDVRWFADKISGSSTTSTENYSGYLYSITGRDTTSNSKYANYKTITNDQKNTLSQAEQDMYCSGISQWFASPCSGYENYYVCLSTGTWIGYEYMTRSCQCCPLVSLKPGVDLTTN